MAKKPVVPAQAVALSPEILAQIAALVTGAQQPAAVAMPAPQQQAVKAVTVPAPVVALGIAQMKVNGAIRFDKNGGAFVNVHGTLTDGNTISGNLWLRT